MRYLFLLIAKATTAKKHYQDYLKKEKRIEIKFWKEESEKIKTPYKKRSYIYYNQINKNWLVQIDEKIF